MGRGRRRALGQHFLRDPRIATRILEVAQVAPGEWVVEVGPGPGALTRPLLDRGARVVALERDFSLCQYLRHRLPGHPHLFLIQTDARTFPLHRIPVPFKVVANLPYAVATPILTHLLSYGPRITSLTLMLQWEVAQRIAASPGTRAFGPLSLFVQFHARVVSCFRVARGAFHPPPRVDSGVVQLLPYAEPPVQVPEPQRLFHRIHLAFQQRRKRLLNALSRLGLPRDVLRRRLEDAGIDPWRRPETLSLEEWVRIDQMVEEMGRFSV